MIITTNKLIMIPDPQTNYLRDYFYNIKNNNKNVYMTMDDKNAKERTHKLDNFLAAKF